MEGHLYVDLDRLLVILMCLIVSSQGYCISGNVPASLMVAGTPIEVKECCRKIIETYAPDGGYILTGGCQDTETKNPENFRVFMGVAAEYGTS